MKDCFFYCCEDGRYFFDGVDKNGNIGRWVERAKGDELVILNFCPFCGRKLSTL